MITSRVALPIRPGVAGLLHRRTLRLERGDVRSLVVDTLIRDGLRNYEPSTAPAILASFERFRRFRLYDVGANAGLYSLMAAALFRPLSVDAFEPTPDLARLANRLAKRNRLPVDVRPVALGAEPGTAELFLSSRSDTSNSLVPGFRLASGSVRVPVSTVDGHVASTGRVPTILKIDTELFDAQVLRGAVATIRRHRPWIVVEAIHTRGVDYGALIAEVMSGHRYHSYELGSRTPWRAQPRVQARAQTSEPDWLLTPEPLDDVFWSRVADWRVALASCGPIRGPVRELRTAAARGRRRVRRLLAELTPPAVPHGHR